MNSKEIFEKIPPFIHDLCISSFPYRQDIDRMEIDPWRTKLRYSTKTFVRSLAFHQWRCFVIWRKLRFVWFMGQNFAPMGFGCWKNHSPFQGPYKGEQKFIQIPLNKCEQRIGLMRKMKNTWNCKMVKHLQFWNAKEHKSDSAIVKETSFHNPLDWGLWLIGRKVPTLVCKSHLFGVAEEQYMASTLSGARVASIA